MSFAFIFFSIFLSACHAQESFAPFFKCSKKMEEPYGICTHITRTGKQYEYETRDKDLSMIERTGATFIRIDFDWNNLIKKGDWIFRYELLDSAVLSSYNSDKKILGILTLHDNFGTVLDWEKYVSQIVMRYKNSCYYWEIINEADSKFRRYSGINVTDYAEFLKRGYRTIKSNNNKAHVLFSGVAYAEKDFVDEVLKNDVRRYFDIMNVHHYASKSIEPEDFISYYEKIGKKLKKYEINKPLWLTETGASTYDNGGVSEAQQAEWLPRMYIISFACGIDKVFWYKSRSNEIDSNDRECCFGLWHKDYFPKPVFYTYKTLIKMCPNKSSRPKLVRLGNVYVSLWKRPDGKKVYALWSSKNEEKLIINIKGNYKIYSDKGEEMEYLSTSDLLVTSSVKYIVGAKSLQISNERIVNITKEADGFTK